MLRQELSGKSKQNKDRSSRPRVERGRRNLRRLRSDSEVVFDEKFSRHIDGLDLKQATYIVFDIETTGGNPAKNGITEICALKYEKGRVVDRFYSLVNPKIRIPPIVRRMTGINNSMVKDAPTADKIFPGFIEFVGDGILVSHNTIGDLKFLRYFARQCCNHNMQNFFLCTHLLVDKLFPDTPDKSLTGLAAYFSIASGDLHLADEDAQVTLDLFRVLYRELYKQGVTQVADAIRFQGDYESGVRLGWAVPDHDVRQLPNKPGILICRNLRGGVVFASAVADLAKEARQLCRYQLLPRPILKAVLQTYSLSYHESPDFFAAMHEESQMPELAQNNIRPHIWHQRYLLTLNIVLEPEGYRLECGVAGKDTVGVFGPVRDRKAVLVALGELASAYDLRKTKGGYIIPAELLDAVTALVIGNLPEWLEEQKQKSRGFLSWFRPWKRGRAKRQAKVGEKLLNLAWPQAMKPMANMMGAVAIPTRNDKWNLYLVSQGKISERRLEQESYVEFFDHFEKRRANSSQGSFILSSPMSYEEAGFFRSSIWWWYAGSRRKGYVTKL